MQRRKLLKRFAPLYVSSFFQGLIFWYAIEKVFMVHIGFHSTTIALAVIIMNITSIVLNIPSGLLADRWSRKGVLGLSCIALGLASFFLGMSGSVTDYVVASCLYGAYSAFGAGAHDATIYDTLMEETGRRVGYEKYLGYTQFIEGVALIIGSLCGAVIGERLGLRAAYLISVPSAGLAAAALLAFRESTLHKQHRDATIIAHLRTTLRAVFHKGDLTWIVIVLLSTTILYEFLLEVDQFWPLALKLGLLWYGPLNALLLFGYGIGSPLASLIMKRRWLVMVSSLLGVVSVALLMVRNMPLIALAQFSVICLFVSLNTYALGKLHDALPSELRSSGSSMVATLSATVFIPALLIFSGITQYHSVFVAARMLVPIALLAFWGVFVISRRQTYRNVEQFTLPITIPSSPVVPQQGTDMEL